MTATVDVPTGNTYDKYASSNPIERRLMAGFMGSLDDLLPATPPATVLEVGLGEGEVSARVRRRYPEARMVGIDLPDPELASAWDDKELAGAFADICALPFADGMFDLVLVIEVLEHVPDPVAALAEVRRVARGHLVASVPREPVWRAANLARGKYLKDLGNTPGHVNHWSKKEFAELIGTQFALTAVRSPFPWTMVGARARP